MIKLENYRLSTHNENNSFKLRLSVDAKAIRGKMNGELDIYISLEYHLTNYILVVTGKTQGYNIGSGYFCPKPVHDPRTSNNGHQALSAHRHGAKGPAHSIICEDFLSEIQGKI